MTAIEEILAKVATRAADSGRRTDYDPPPQQPRPLTDSSILTKLEKDLGFQLPDLLKRLYLEVGDGGFGPGYGMFGAKSGHHLSDEPFTLAEIYHTNHNGDWPDMLVPICDWGCIIWSCIDCSHENYPVVMMFWDWTDPETGKECHGYLSEGIEFREWIEAWADGVDLWERFKRATKKV